MFKRNLFLCRLFWIIGEVVKKIMILTGVPLFAIYFIAVTAMTIAGETQPNQLLMGIAAGLTLPFCVSMVVWIYVQDRAADQFNSVFDNLDQKDAHNFENIWPRIRLPEAVKIEMLCDWIALFADNRIVVYGLCVGYRTPQKEHAFRLVSLTLLLVTRGILPKRKMEELIIRIERETAKPTLIRCLSGI